jgi:CCR4-NOT transcription complex subunit 6
LDPTGTATFWKVSKFSFIGKRVVHFNNISDNFPRSPDRYKTGHTGQISLFQTVDLAEPKALCVANTHQFWDPGFPDVKTLQAHHLIVQTFEYMNSAPVKDLNPSILVCGDFNSLPDSDVYRLLSKGLIQNPQSCPLPLLRIPYVSKRFQKKRT